MADIVTPHDSLNEQYYGTIIFPKISNLPRLTYVFPGFLIVPLYLALLSLSIKQFWMIIHRKQFW